MCDEIINLFALNSGGQIDFQNASVIRRVLKISIILNLYILSII